MLVCSHPKTNKLGLSTDTENWDTPMTRNHFVRHRAWAVSGFKLYRSVFSLPPHIFRQKLANSDYKGSTELYRLFIAADSINDATDSSGVLLCDPKKFSPNSVPADFSS